MGYYTNYGLEIIEGDSNEIDHEQGIEEYTDYNNVFGEEIKWYNCHEDMIAYSKKYPNTVFCITGEGEEAGDLWKTYFKNGQSQQVKAKIVYDEYNADLLK